MKKLLVLALVAFISIATFAQQTKSHEFSPQAHQDAQIVFGKARFTVMTPRLIRMEWAEDSQFLSGHRKPLFCF